MTWAVAGVVCLALATWLAIPSRTAPLVRLAPGRIRRPSTPGRVATALSRFRPGRNAQSAECHELPQALELLAACLAAGAPMSAAVTTVAEVSAPRTKEVLDLVASQLHLGRSASDAWLTLTEHPAWAAPARDVARSARSGTSLAQVLQVHADDARRRVAAAASKAARQVGVRSVLPLMVCFLPAFVFVGVVPIIAGLLTGFLGP